MKEKKSSITNDIKNIPTSIQNDINTNSNDIQFVKDKNNSDLITAINILHSSENIESNTILTNEQVNGLSLMNWAGQVYNIEFFKQYVSLFPKYRISGDDGRGRSEIIEIANAIQREKIAENNRIIDILGRKG